MSRFNLDTEFCRQCGMDGGLCAGCVKKKCYLDGVSDALAEVATYRTNVVNQINNCCLLQIWEDKLDGIKQKLGGNND